jgi:TolB protein
VGWSSPLPRPLPGFPAFSPDGDRIAFTTSCRGDFFEIFTMSADGSNPRNLTRNQIDDFDPDFSPDGKHLAFTTSRDGNDEVYTVKADGSVPRNVTQEPSNPDQNPSWQPTRQ